jgi:elongation factor 3
MKAELADKGKAKANARAGALRGARALIEKHGASAESIACMLLQEGFEAMADKLKPVSVEADKFVAALFDKLSPHAVKAVLPDVLREYDGKWQSNLGRAVCLKTIADKFPKQTNRLLTDIVPVLSGLMWDTKAQVKEQATEAMKTGEQAAPTPPRAAARHAGHSPAPHAARRPEALVPPPQ